MKWNGCQKKKGISFASVPSSSAVRAAVRIVQIIQIITDLGQEYRDSRV